jgi:hypothetical protein
MEGPFDPERAVRRFEQANAALRADKVTLNYN